MSVKRFTQRSLTRRTFLRQTAVLGAGVTLAACAPAPAPAGESAAPAAPAAPAELPFEVAEGALNPLGLEPGTSVEGVFFEGGLGRDYLDNAAELFRALHPENEMSVEGIQQVGERLRPRFIGGNPPDVIDNSGAGNLDVTALIAEDQLMDLAPLFNAPALDTPGATVGETLLPGSQLSGQYSGTQYELNITTTIFGIWHSQTLFEEMGWEYPTTWDEMLSFSQMIKDETEMSPWIYQGRFPQYMLFGVLMPLVYKIGGIEPILAIDNLEEGAWQDPAVVEATNMMYQLHEMDLIMPGTEGLTHTESQAEWLQGNAVFIPCGSWLENEMRDLTPEDFDMVVKPVPGPTEDDYSAMLVRAGEPFIVPAEAQNPIGGMEYLRVLLSKESARFFAENVGIVMPVLGGTEGITLSSALQSAIATSEAAGDEVFDYRFRGWYSDFATEVVNGIGEMLTGRMTPDELLAIAEEKAAETKADDSIIKYERNL